MNQAFQQSYRAPYQAQADSDLVEAVRGMSSSEIEQLRWQAQHDRYFLARGVLGYRDVNPYTHGPMCRFIEDRSKTRRMGLAPRGHLKSTLWTVTDCVGLALEDPEECRILLINEIEGNAMGFLSEIKAHFENNDLLPILFPELIPTRLTGPGSRWSSGAACLPRSTAYKEWTWSAVGVGSAVTSRHFTNIKCDDLIGFEARESPANMKYAITYAKTLEPLLVDMDQNFLDFWGTRWALYDLYREMLEAYGEDMAYFSREDIEEVPEMPLDMLRKCGFGYDKHAKRQLTDDETLAKIGTQQPIFPAKFSLQQLQRLSVIDPVLYYAQYKNSPIAAGIKDFSTERVRYFDFDSRGNIVWRDSKGLIQRWAKESLDVVMCVDPNSGSLTAPDLPAIVVAALSPYRQVFVLETWSKRVQPDTFIDMIFEIWKRWLPRVLGIEKAGQQTTSFYFSKKMMDEGVYIDVQPLMHRNRVKEERIRKALQPVVNTGRLFVRKTQTVLMHQLKFYPDLSNDDEIDALSYATEVFRNPLSQAEIDEEEDAVELVMSRRDPITGY